MGAYDKQVAGAVAKIRAKGQAVKVRRFERAVPPDPSKPWNAGAKTPVDSDVHAVFLDYEASDFKARVEWGSQERDETRIRQGDMKALVAGGAVPFEITTAMKLVRGGKELEIVTVGKLQPAEQVILYTLQVRE